MELHVAAADAGSAAAVVYRSASAELKRLGVGPQSVRPYLAEAVRREQLPFRVRIVEDAKDLEKAVEVRASAFSKHLPSMARAMSAAEAEDQRLDSILLIAERKIDGTPIGSMRLQPNIGRRLRLQGETEKLDHLGTSRLVEATRLAVFDEAVGSLATIALVKATYEVCFHGGVDYVIAGGRRSMLPLFRLWCYDQLEGGPVPISYGNNIPHWIFVLPIAEVERRWQSRSKTYYEFAARTDHPDIVVDPTVVREIWRGFR